MAAHRSSMLALTILLVLASATAASASAPRPTFESLLQAAIQRDAEGASATVASAGGSASGYSTEADYYSYYDQQYSSPYGHSEVAMLTETAQPSTTCRTFGCQKEVNMCDPTVGTCNFCTSGFHVTSQFACMRDEEHYYSSYGHGVDQRLGFNGLLQSGYCNWDVMKFRDQTYTRTTTGPQGFFSYAPVNSCGWIKITDSTYQIGTATAKCFFPGGDDCEGPLCKSLRITISADVYASEAYSHVANSAVSAACWQFLDTPNSALNPTDCPIWGLPGTVSPIFGPQGSGVPFRSAEASADSAKVSTANYDHRTLSVYKGYAIIVSGQITSVNGARYEKDGARYTDGLIEYVPYFINSLPSLGGTTAWTGAIDPNLPFVRPNSYKLEFAKDGARYSA